MSELNATVEKKIIKYFTCTCGHHEQHSISHLDEREGASFGPWYCDSCEISWWGKFGNGKWNIRPNKDRRLRKTTACVKFGGSHPFFILTESSQFTDNGFWSSGGNDRYYFEEHTCPVNILRSAQNIIYDGDDDRHGLFEYIGSGKRIEDDESPFDWAKENIGLKINRCLSLK